jgi:uroporphyrinogen-III decarboxylase
MMTFDNNWAALTWQEKREKRFGRWLNPPQANFASPHAEEAYKTRVERYISAIKVEEGDRVPVNSPSGFFPAIYAGGTLKSAMYNYDELRDAWLLFLKDFDLDSFGGPGLVLPGKMIDDIDYKIHHWPGHGLADDVTMYQYIEGEYMPPEDYDAFINDPTGYLFRTYLPRIVGAFGGFSKLGPLTPFVGIPIGLISQFNSPEVRASIRALLDAADECAKWQDAVGAVSKAAISAGVPSLGGGFSGAPYDLLGDMMRGTKGIMMDMYKRPGKLIEAMERMTPIVIEEGVRFANMTGCPVIMMPLHKGTGGFMSNKQFETFYWPTLKKVLTGLIDEGLVPMPFAEGDYEARLEIIADMPRTSTIWYFEAMDMAKAKRIVGKDFCIAGNLPASILCTGTPEEVKEACRKLIETCAPGGGYMLAGAASMDKGDPGNLRAMMDAAKEYGTFKK